MTTPGTYNHYDIGQLVRLSATFVSTDLQTTADPSTIVLLVKNGAGSIASYTYLAAGASVIRAGTGAYWREITIENYGDLYYRWLGTGGVQAVEEWQLASERSFIL